MEQIVKNNVNKDYDKIYFFILGKKQDRYSVDFPKYNTLDCSENNIWDVSDIISWCTHYDSVHIEQVWNVIKRELVIDDAKSNILINIKKGILELKNTVHSILETSNQLIQTHYASIKYIEDANNSLNELDQMLPYLDENTYIACKEVLEDGLELEKILQIHQKWEWKIELKCIYIRCNALVEKNLQEASELIANDCISYQLRVDWSGDVYISTITGAEEIDDVKFRWESWDPGNEYAEPCAASDHEYVKNSVASLKKCWEDGVRVYCDYYAIL